MSETPRCPNCGEELEYMEYVNLSVSWGTFDRYYEYDSDDARELECIYRCPSCGTIIANSEADAIEFFETGKLPEERKFPQRLREAMREVASLYEAHHFQPPAELTSSG